MRWLLIFLAAVSLTSCTFQEVAVSDIRSVEFSEFSQKKLAISASVKVNNPNNFDISVTDSDVALYLAGKYTGQAKIVENLKIPANFDDYIPVKIEADMSQAGNALLPVIMSGLLKKSVFVKAEGYVKARHFLFSKKIPLEIAEEVRL